MRWMRDIVAAAGLAAVIGGAVYFNRARKADDALLQRAQGEVKRMEQEIKYRAATKTAELNARGWPVTIDPAWFQNGAPGNALLDEERPWVEVAGTQQADFMHPPVRMAVDGSLAAFWYNPYQGVIRARVPVMVSDDKATEMYNKVNGVSMSSIFAREAVADRPKTPPAAPKAEPVAAEGESESSVASEPSRPTPTSFVRRGAPTRGKR